MAIPEVNQDQEVKDGHENEHDAAAASESEGWQSAEQNLEQSDEPTTASEPQAVEVATPAAGPEIASAGAEEEDFVDSEAAGDDNGASDALALSEDQAATPPLPASSAENLSPEQTQEKPQGFFRRRTQTQELKRLRGENEKLAGEVEAMRERYMRLAAEMENFRKRTDRDFYSRVQTEVARLVTALLPLLDDLERCLTAKDETQDYEALKNGVALIHQKFVKVLDVYGVTPMTVVGEEFDPNFHEALAALESEDRPTGTVLEEHSKGYMIRDKVLRPAQVVVSK